MRAEAAGGAGEDALHQKSDDDDDRKKLVVVVAGCTGVGKSDVAAFLCDASTESRRREGRPGRYGGGGIVVSADSVQALPYVRIGANKPTQSELERTPHVLVDIVTGTDDDGDDGIGTAAADDGGTKSTDDAIPTVDYNAAEWRRDAMYAIRQCLLEEDEEEDDDDDDDDDDDVVEDFEANGVDVDVARRKRRRRRQQRKVAIRECVRDGKQLKGYPQEEPVLPVVVGGTMMWLNWLVRGRPDAVRPTPAAASEARRIVEEFCYCDNNEISVVPGDADDSDVVINNNNNKNDTAENNDSNISNWRQAVRYVESLGDVYRQQVSKLSDNDWYRLRRILEVAFTVREQQQQRQHGEGEQEEDEAKQVPYSGKRSGGLLSPEFGYDVRCFFLCPNDRMKHTELVDERCEQMVRLGLLQETADLAVSDRLPDMAAKAIGYRQSLEYLGRPGPRDDDEDAFVAFLEQFTTATRQYAKKQMQWFRRDSEFVFVPVDVGAEKSERVRRTAEEIERMLSLSREEYDAERNSEDGASAIARSENVAQGRKMKLYSFKRHILKPGSRELRDSMAQADQCTHRFQSK